MPLSSSRFALVLLAALPALAPAQGRRSLAGDDPQALLLGYYSAAMLMTPAGLAGPGFEVGGELTLLPALSEEQRRVGFGGTKLEKTNFCPVLPRARFAASPGAGTIEVGFVPPVEVCGVRALLLSAAFTRRMPLNETWSWALRGSVLVGSLEAAITCPAEAIANPLDQTCFGGSESEDRVAPFTLGAEALLVRGSSDSRLGLYALAGVRRELNRFDVNYVRDTVLPFLDDHERLVSSKVRLHGAAGGTWRIGARLSAGTELFYAPGALLTLRARLGYRLGVMR